MSTPALAVLALVVVLNLGAHSFLRRRGIRWGAGGRGAASEASAPPPAPPPPPRGATVEELVLYAHNRWHQNDPSWGCKICTDEQGVGEGPWPLKD